MKKIHFIFFVFSIFSLVVTPNIFAINAKNIKSHGLDIIVTVPARSSITIALTETPKFLEDNNTRGHQHINNIRCIITQHSQPHNNLASLSLSRATSKPITFQGGYLSECRYAISCYAGSKKIDTKSLIKCSIIKTKDISSSRHIRYQLTEVEASIVGIVTVSCAAFLAKQLLGKTQKSTSATPTSDDPVERELATQAYIAACYAQANIAHGIPTQKDKNSSPTEAQQCKTVKKNSKNQRVSISESEPQVITLDPGEPYYRPKKPVSPLCYPWPSQKEKKG